MATIFIGRDLGAAVIGANEYWLAIRAGHRADGKAQLPDILGIGAVWWHNLRHLYLRTDLAFRRWRGLPSGARFGMPRFHTTLDGRVELAAFEADNVCGRLETPDDFSLKYSKARE